MKRLDFWRSDWFLGVVVAVVLLGFSGGDLIQSLERKAYDLGLQAATRAPSDRIAVIAIDDQSIANIGRWPWSREVHAKMTDILAGAKAKVIASSTFFFEPQIDSGLAYVNRLLEIYNRNVPRPPLDPGVGAPAGSASSELAQFGTVLAEAEQALNTDRKLAESFKRAGNVLLPMVFQALAEPQGAPDPKKPLPHYVLKNSLTLTSAGADVPAMPGSNPFYPIAELGNTAHAIGHLNSHNDVDGAVRAEPLLVRHYDRYLPSLALVVVATSLNLPVTDIKPVPGEEVRLGKLRVRTDPELRMYTFFYSDRDGRSAFAVDSFFDVISGKIPASKYHDKIVLIGATAAGLGTAQVTPISPSTSPVLTLAHTVSSILGEHFFVVPTWGIWVEKGVFLLVALYLILLLPHFRAALAGMLSLAIGVALVIAHFSLMVTQLMWIQLMAAVVLLAVGYAALITKRFLVTERGKEVADADLIVTNRNLGLAEQGRGNLDSAYDHFRRLPKEERTAELLYNLALDFERKRQFNKAEAVFLYIAQWEPKFRDVQERAQRSKAMSETVILGGAGAHPGGTMILNVGEKPMLGRYQVEKELGKGAMGVVYQGKDPKIGRVVAIKTLALAQEFEADELQDVKERFFREAETAGRLAHPNIVTIYDAGEEHDLAYIAMEFLKGKDLAPYVKPDNLLSLDKVLSIIARVSDALAYAHKNNVVHRDVKPANIMWEADSDTVKVTDFGIARITDSSKTKTGMVLGTPSYMSPEQLAGKKIEGRSDLFSLGVTLYQLACGNLPFQGDSMAQLMFKIANEPHPDIRTYNPKLPACVAAIVNRTLAKDPESRYQDGEQMAKALRLCLQSLSSSARPTPAGPTPATS
ncbi:MAG: CHASE2 domain-containing protein [Betaproteobacteria bacterium]|nr:CHASE2 domain-containing protein [Betaproteobacteria bacterium]